jgi:hypothetical protein
VPAFPLADSGKINPTLTSPAPTFDATEGVGSDAIAVGGAALLG